MHMPLTAELDQLGVGDLVRMASAQPVLDEAEEQDLARSAKRGNQEALQRLVLGNLRIAVDEAIRTRGLGLSQDKLVRTGVGALLEAVSSYDPEAHGRFSDHVRSRVRLVMRESIS